MTATAPTPVPSPRRVTWIGIAIAVLVTVGIVVALAASEWRDDGTTVSTTVLVGSGTLASQTRDVPAFAAVELTGATNVTVGVGGATSVVVSGDDNLLSHVTTEVEDGMLAIGTEGSFQTTAPLSVTVSTPSLDAVELTGSGEVVVTGVEGPSFDATLSGSGVLLATGMADRLDATLSGSGDLRLEELVASQASAVVSGTGRLDVHATESLDASVTGAGEIVYRGEPVHLTESVTGTGTIGPG
jgi:hypothetical protein